VPHTLKGEILDEEKGQFNEDEKGERGA